MVHFDLSVRIQDEQLKRFILDAGLITKSDIAAAEKIAKEESRTRSELFREALRQYIDNRERWQEIRKWGTETANEYGIKSEADVNRLVQEFRKENK